MKRAMPKIQRARFGVYLRVWLATGLGGRRRKVEEERRDSEPVNYDTSIIGAVRIGKVWVDEAGR